MVLDNGRPLSDQIMQWPVPDKAEFMRHALTEAHMYGAPSVSDWLFDRYGLTRDQALDIALDVLTSNGAEPLTVRN